LAFLEELILTVDYEVPINQWRMRLSIQAIALLELVIALAFLPQVVRNPLKVLLSCRSLNGSHNEVIWGIRWVKLVSTATTAVVVWAAVVKG